MLKVVPLPVDDARDVDLILDEASQAELSDVLVLGWTKDGEFWTSINFSDGPNALWLLELAKTKLMKGVLE